MVKWRLWVEGNWISLVFRRLSREDNDGFVSGIGTFKFYSVNIKCRVGWDFNEGLGKGVLSDVWVQSGKGILSKIENSIWWKGEHFV